jgi:hypothetical protein
MDQARDFVSAHPNLSDRDAVHAAVVRVYNLEGICTFDRDVDNRSRIVPRPPPPRNGNTPANTPLAGTGPVSARFTNSSARRTTRSIHFCFADSFRKLGGAASAAGLDRRHPKSHHQFPSLRRNQK